MRGKDTREVPGRGGDAGDGDVTATPSALPAQERKRFRSTGPAAMDLELDFEMELDFEEAPPGVPAQSSPLMTRGGGSQRASGLQHHLLRSDHPDGAFDVRSFGRPVRPSEMRPCDAPALRLPRVAPALLALPCATRLLTRFARHSAPMMHVCLRRRHTEFSRSRFPTREGSRTLRAGPMATLLAPLSPRRTPPTPWTPRAASRSGSGRPRT